LYGGSGNPYLSDAWGSTSTATSCY
jgi:hypothetical protein